MIVNPEEGTLLLEGEYTKLAEFKTTGGEWTRESPVIFAGLKPNNGPVGIFFHHDPEPDGGSYLYKDLADIKSMIESLGEADNWELVFRADRKTFEKFATY